MSDNMKDIIKSVLILLAVFLAVLGLRKFVFTPVDVFGSSMEPTLVDGERTIGLFHSKINRFDIVTLPAPDKEGEGKNYIKRVIGLPGDTIEFKEGVLYINGEKTAESYLDEYTKALTDGNPLTQIDGSISTFDLKTLQEKYADSPDVDFELTEDGKIPEGRIFVLGDNRRNSKDSRMIGLIDEEKVIANVKLVIWPLNKIGLLN